MNTDAHAQPYVAYRPIVELASGRVCRTGARLGRTPAVAGSSGLGALSYACAQAQQWCASGVPTTPIAVSVSAMDLEADGIAEYVTTVLAKHDLDPQWLTIEISEKMMICCSARVDRTMLELREMGIAIAIDNFGAGYSSLSHLKRFSVDCLKVDRGFVAGLTSNDIDIAIVRTVIGIGRKLGLSVVAKGVDTREQAEFLTDEGCPEVQGDYFHKPMSTNDMTELLLRDSGAIVAAYGNRAVVGAW